MNSVQRYKNDQAELCYEKKGMACLHCGKPANQLAHILPQDKVMLRKYGYRVVHHWLNRDPVCSLRCNGKSSIRNRPLDIEAKVKEIEEEINGD